MKDFDMALTLADRAKRNVPPMKSVGVIDLRLALRRGKAKY
jgi:hypothetical protein